MRRTTVTPSSTPIHQSSDIHLAALVADPACVVDLACPFQLVLVGLKLVWGLEVPQYVVTVLVEEAVVGVVVGGKGYHCDVDDGYPSIGVHLGDQPLHLAVVGNQHLAHGSQPLLLQHITMTSYP
jgi:hypothetical protein